MRNPRVSLSKVDIEVLKCTANGVTIKEVSDKLNLTNAKVIYSIKVARKIFDAKNVAHTISKAYKLKILKYDTAN